MGESEVTSLPEALPTFEAHCQTIAADLEDRRRRDVSSPRIIGTFTTENDLERETAWLFIYRSIVGRFPWEISS